MSNFDISSAERVGIPKGDDKAPCIQAFEDATGIEVPPFSDRGLSVVSQGVTFYSLKGANIPGLVNDNFLDVGLAGTDSVLEYKLANKRRVCSQRIGEPMCRLVLMAEADNEDEVRGILNSDRRRPGRMLRVATPLPNIVDAIAMGSDEPFCAFRLPEGITVSGSFEVMPKLLEEPEVKLVADLVQSGETAKANGLVEVMPLLDIYPEIVQGVENENN